MKAFDSFLRGASVLFFSTSVFSAQPEPADSNSLLVNHEGSWIASRYDSERKAIESGQRVCTDVCFGASAYYYSYWIDAALRNKPEEALTVLQKASAIWPHDDCIYWLMSRTYRFQLKDPAKAEERLRQGQQLFEQNANWYRQSDIYHYTLAMRHVSVQEYEAAYRECVLAIDSGEEKRRIVKKTLRGTGYHHWSNLFYERSAYYFGYWIARFCLKRPQAAIDILDRGFEVWPELAKIYQWEAYACEDSKDYGMMQKYLQQAIAIEERQPDTASKYVYEGSPPHARKESLPGNRRVVAEQLMQTWKLVDCYLDEVDDQAPDKVRQNTRAAHDLLMGLQPLLKEHARAMGCADKEFSPWGGQEYFRHMSRLYGDYPECEWHDNAKALQYALDADVQVQQWNAYSRARGESFDAHVSSVTGLIGLRYLALGDYDKAIKYLEEYGWVWWGVLEPAATFGYLSQAYEKKADLMRQQAGAQRGPQEEGTNATRTLVADASDPQVRAALEKARAAMERSIDGMNSLWSYRGTDESKVSAEGRVWRRFLDHGIRLNLRLGNPNRAFEIMEFGKARALADLMSSYEPPKEKATFLAQAESEREELLKRTDALQVQIQAERGGSNAVQVASLQRSLVLVQDKVARLRENMANCEREVRSAKTVPSIALRAAQEMMAAANATLIEYWDTNTVAVVSRDNIRVLTLATPASAVEVEAFREAIRAQSAVSRGLELEAQRPNNTASTNEVFRLSRKLYEALLRPVEGHIQTELVLLSPDGVLNFLPFQALHDGTNYFAATHSLAYVPSASVLQSCLGRRGKVGAKILALGNPNLQERQYRLAHAEEEVKAVAGLFPDTRVLIGNEATEKSVQLLGRDFDVLHFACHGEIHLDAPMRSCLRLAPDADNDGYLHAGELFGLHLNARLVTLSACESGLGRVTPGNEVLGLTRAFLFAGTPSVVASLWRVDDAATAKLMVEFYRGLKAGKNKAQALRDAQVQMIKDGYTPFYWAAFCLYGDYM